MIITIIETIYRFLWGDFLQIPLPGGGSVGISLLIILLIPVGIYFTIRTRVLPVRLFSEMVKALLEKKKEESSLSTFQTLIVSTATRVGMGNLVGVVAAISAGGHWHSFTRRRTLCTVVTGAVRLIIYITI